MSHTEVGEAAHRDPNLERLLFFSDGVFAIAITLLSIELHPPHNWDGSFAQLWGRGWPMLMAYFISFAVIGVFWNAHRRLFSYIRRYSTGVFALNLILLGLVALMPFVTNQLYSFGPRGDVLILYLALISATGAAQGLIYAYAAFVARSTTPIHPIRQLSAILMMTLTPGLASALSLFGSGLAFGQAERLPLVLGFSLALASLIGFRIWTAKRFGG